jgi:GAF domain-containing protein
MDLPGSKDVGRLLCLEADIAAATASFATTGTLLPVQSFLHELREALGMDVAFVSQFVGDRRRFEVVSIDGADPPGIVAGDSDTLLDTYCKLVATGELPAVVCDAHEHPEVSSLAITTTLKIRSYLSAPVVLKGGKVFGTVCCYSHVPRSDLAYRDAAALIAIADAIALAVQKDLTISTPIWS